MFDTIVKALSDFALWLLDLVLWFPKTVFAWLMEGTAEALVVVMDSVCVQACIAAAEGLNTGMSQIPPFVIYFTDFFQLGYGFSLVICAYIGRFLIRRIPFIG